MPIEFRCSQCGRLLQTPDETAGGEAQCPQCGAVQEIPAASRDVPPGNTPPGPPPLPDAARRYASERVQAPAVGLMLVGALGAATQVLGVLSGMMRLRMLPAFGPRGWGAPAAMMSGNASLMVGVVLLALAVLVLYGAWMMWNLERYSWAMAAAIIALVPCTSPCCILGFPLGIWALAVLSDPAVKTAFRS
jgi:phage FluMu protein Com